MAQSLDTRLYKGEKREGGREREKERGRERGRERERGGRECVHFSYRHLYISPVGVVSGCG